ncbi:MULTISPECIES: S24 family peptidase [unclassified Xanthomonas]|uniref:XRE family transcriptional regulator n=1 Tax=unclassified Xanthomonas TaxID=2643310 RepID=UPI002A7F7FA9|nr:MULTISPECIES: S24 family peptidase [unclassified Xanthomonas]MDY4297540.1 S24 family peptidase [Xanthomonas sp. LF02-5]MDY4359334.1 S24 family peptidase [Xanthomonas sp. LF04-12]
MNTNKELRDRLIFQMREKGVRASEVAEWCGVSQQAVFNWRKNGRIDRRHFIALTNRFNVPLEYWLGAEEPQEQPRPGKASPHTYGVRNDEANGTGPVLEVTFPVYDIDVSGGPSAATPELIETRYRVCYQMDWLDRWDAKADDILIARVRGSSMEPVLYDGDKAVIHRGRTRVRNDTVYSLIYGGDARVKRLFTLADGGLRIVSDNPDKARYPDEIVPPDELSQVYVIGQVIEKMGSGGL